MGVLGFHAGLAWLRGGYLPITTFFVLSGFLITSLLLLEIQQRGRIDFPRFWGARARRLVPAALIGLLLAAFVAHVISSPGHVEGDAVSALLWMANWRFVASGQSYASLFAHPSPLQHYWTLAVEEQFYLVLPLIVGATVVWIGRGRRQVFAVVTLSLLIASLVATRLLYQPGVVLRTYYGTDTRAAELLVGVLLAVVLVDRQGLRRFGRPARVLADVCALPALVALVAMWVFVHQYDKWLLDGGFTIVALVAAVVLVGATQPGTFVGKVLSVRPLAWLGRVSYGAYIYHWPLFLLLTPARTGMSGPVLLAFRLAVVLIAAQLSYRYIELPIREGRLPRPVAALSWANGAVAVVAVFVLV
ncbi:MAG: acyltransferase, partial [Acidimicrobiia bacterium]|nr:acyltransferase [Acidimicrobiia bacterium]